MCVSIVCVSASDEYAQIFFKKMFRKASELKFQRTLEKFNIIDKCISESLTQGDTHKNADKIMSDFYLTSFDPCLNLISPHSVQSKGTQFHTSFKVSPFGEQNVFQPDCG